VWNGDYIVNFVASSLCRSAAQSEDFDDFSRTIKAFEITYILRKKSTNEDEGQAVAIVHVIGEKTWSEVTSFFGLELAACSAIFEHLGMVKCF
jgi:hypothetical protein